MDSISTERDDIWKGEISFAIRDEKSHVVGIEGGRLEIKSTWRDLHILGAVGPVHREKAREEMLLSSGNFSPTSESVLLSQAQEGTLVYDTVAGERKQFRIRVLGWREGPSTLGGDKVIGVLAIERI